MGNGNYKMIWETFKFCSFAIAVHLILDDDNLHKTLDISH